MQNFSTEDVAPNIGVQKTESRVLQPNCCVVDKTVHSPTHGKERVSNCSELGKEHPNPPKAHSTSQSSFCQVTQPLCLQTSSRKPVLQEREMKPLNMQIINSES